MPTLGQRDWGLGWIASDDDINARDRGLIRMDNVSLDETGALSLCGGAEKIAPNFASVVLKVWSKTINGVKHRFAGLANGSIVYDLNEAGTFSNTLISSGFTGTPALSVAMSQVIGTYGTAKRKLASDGIRNLGVDIPTSAPSNVQLVAQQNVSVIGAITTPPWTAIFGSGINSSGGAIQIPVNIDTKKIIIQSIFNVDATALGGTTGNFSSEDAFNLGSFYTSNFAGTINDITVVFYLSTPPTTETGIATDYFTHTFNTGDFSAGHHYGISIAKRGNFIRVGNDPLLGWANVKGVRIIVNATGGNTFGLFSMQFVGGLLQLTGEYDYLQVNVHDNGKYIAKSPVGPRSIKITAANQKIKLQPEGPAGFFSSPQRVNQIWMYRRKPAVDNNFYLIAVRTDLSQFEDGLSDQDAINRNWTGAPLDHIADLFLIHPPDGIIDISEMYLDRLFYLTTDALYVSHRLNPDAVDSRYIFKFSGTGSERNLWIRKVSDSQLLVGTTRDIYEVSGTGVSQLDGTIDFIIRPLSVSDPPISKAATVYNGALYYIGREGWVEISGSSKKNITGDLRLLFSKKSRHGIAPVLLLGDNQVNFDCAVAFGKLYTIATISASTRFVYVYDITKQYWYMYKTDPTTLYTEDDGNLIAGYGGAQNTVRKLETGTLFDGLLKQPFLIQSGYLDNNEPDRRKDVNVLRVYADSGDDLVQVTIKGNGGAVTQTLTPVRFNGMTLRSFDIGDTVNLSRNFQIEIRGDSVLRFKLAYWSMDYEERPKLLNKINVLGQNFGIAGRKRFYDLPFVFAAFSQDFTVTPVIDNANFAPLSFTGNPSEKKLYTLTFGQEMIGHEIGMIIKFTSPFAVGEFYELIKPRNIELLPDLARFLQIPYSNFGKTARKRFQQYAFVIDTRGNNVTFTPIIDGIGFPSLIVNTTRKQTVIYTFTTDAIGIDIGGTFILASGPFEFYGPSIEESVYEVLPPITKFYRGKTDFGTSSRKRFSQISFVLDPRGGIFSFTPILDGVTQVAQTFTGNRRQTFTYYFSTDVVFVDLDFIIQTTNNIAFEFYEIQKPEILEILPPPVKFYHIPTTNLGTNSRKRWHTFAFVIDTKGQNVTFTPIIDGISGTTSIVNTNGKRTYTHFFTTNTVGVDIRGTLLGSNEFEFYGVNIDETITEKLPPRAKRLNITASNFGVASKKRVRTIPLVIDTFGSSVSFTPMVDGISLPASNHVTNGKTTVYHYFEQDTFGTDYSGLLVGTNEFEFYKMESPAVVEILPIPKKWDQFGPFEFDKNAWLRAMRLRLIPEGSLILYRVFLQDVELASGSLIVVPNIEDQYNISFEQGLRGQVVRIELESSLPYYKISGELRYSETGGATELKKLKLFDKPVNRQS